MFVLQSFFGYEICDWIVYVICNEFVNVKCVENGIGIGCEIGNEIVYEIFYDFECKMSWMIYYVILIEVLFKLVIVVDCF